MKKTIAFVCCLLLTAANFAVPAQAAGLAPQLYSYTPACRLIFLPPDNLNLILYIAMLPILFLIGLILGLIKNPSIKKHEKNNKKKEEPTEKPAAAKPDTPAPRNNTPTSDDFPAHPVNSGNRYRRYW